MKKVVVVLALLAVAIVLHHWFTHGNLADSKNILSHEFLLSIVLGALLGGLFL